MGESSDSSKSKEYRCETCHDQQYVAVYEGQTLPMDSPDLIGVIYSAIPCDCLKRENLMRMFSRSNIAEENRDKGFNNFNRDGVARCVEEAFKTIYDYYLNFEKVRHEPVNSIVVLGESGSGKSHLLTALCNNLMQKKQVSVIYFRWEEGMRNLKRAIKNDTLDKRIQAMYEVDVLYIDDLFKSQGNSAKISDFEFKQMLDVVDYRNNARMPMLVSSELFDQELADIDIAFWGRIRERSKVLRMGLEDDEIANGVQINYRMR